MGVFNFFFGKSDSAKAQRDQWRPSVVAKNVISPINDYGTCFACEGTGQRTLECKVCVGSGQHQGVCDGCGGSGRFERPAKLCFTCQGTGMKAEAKCRSCEGTGNFKPAIADVCRRCSGSGRFSATCRKCGGAGKFTVTCQKCGGSGWHKFKR